MKTISTTLFLYLLVANATAQNVGINATTPQTTLDVNGDFALRAGSLALSAGISNNIDLATNRFSFYNVSGTGNKTFTGFAGGKDGRMVTLHNNSASPFTLSGNDLSSLAENRILITDESNRQVKPNENITLVYNGALSKWIIQNSSLSNGWNQTGNTATDSATDFLGTMDTKPLMLRVANGYAGRLGSNGIVAIGRGAAKNYNDESIVAIGDSVLFNNGTVSSVYGYTGNTGVGSKALVKNTYGGDNTAIGNNAMYSNTQGDDNTVVGSYALYANTTGTQNDVLGRGAMEANTSGGANVAIGRLSLNKNVNGFRNTTVGNQSMYNNISGSSNTTIGYQADLLSSNINNSTAIGANARVSNANSMAFGDITVNSWGFGRQYENTGCALQVGNYATNGNGAYLTNGGVWTNTSDSTKKEAITKLDGAAILAKIKQLPVTRWKYKGTEEYHIGPMAQDFYNLFQTGLDNTSISSIDPAGVALKAVQAQQEIIEGQNKRITALEDKLARLLQQK